MHISPVPDYSFSALYPDALIIKPLFLSIFQVFCAAVIKLTSMQMQALGEAFSLEQVCGGVSVFPSSEKTISMLIHLILPLAVRMGCGRRGNGLFCDINDKERASKDNAFVLYM